MTKYITNSMTFAFQLDISRRPLKANCRSALCSLCERSVVCFAVVTTYKIQIQRYFDINFIV